MSRSVVIVLVVLLSACSSRPAAFARSPGGGEAGAGGTAGSGGPDGGSGGEVATGGAGGSAEGGAGGSGGEAQGGSGGEAQGGSGGSEAGGSGGIGGGTGEGGSGGTGGESCEGAGEACQTGMLGICADGVTQCPPGTDNPLCLPVQADACTPAAPVLTEPRAGAYTGSVLEGPGTVALRPVFAWKAVDGATDYDLQVDDSCVAGDLEACAFPSPEADVFVPARSDPRVALVSDLPVSTEAPVGRFYAWRVRSCLSQVCSAWSPPRALHVGRLPDDYDGDGHADALLAAPSLGQVEVRYAGRTDAIGAEAVGANSFGRAVAFAGDVNGDGFADAIVSGSLSDRLGAAFLLLGGPDGLSADRVRTSSQAGDYGAAVIGAGDLDGDGLDDVAVGSIDLVPSVSVHFGLSKKDAVVLEGPLNSHFGAALAPAYLDDGLPGLVVGAPFLEDHVENQLFVGAMFVFAGSPEGIDATPLKQLDNPEDVRFSKDFGSVIASTPATRARESKPAYAVSARIGNEPDRVFTCTSDFTCTRLVAAGTGGAALAFVHGSSIDDALVIGNPGTREGGQVVLFLRDGTTFTELGHVEGDDGAGGRFGAALVAGDFAGTGITELLVGAPGASRVYLYGLSGILQLERQDVIDLPGIGAPLALLRLLPAGG